MECEACFTPLGGGPQDALPVGTELAGGRYRIEALLGRGGFAITYRGFHRALNKPVAIKEFLPSDTRLCLRSGDGITVVAGQDCHAFERAREQFKQEAQLLGRLHHTRVVGCLDQFSENGTEYLVMDLVEGQTLEAWVLERRPDRKRALALFRQLLEAVEAVHGAGLVHRDLNPRNIMLQAKNGQPVLIDFGLARAKGEGTATVGFTDGYTAPEQYDPNCPRDVKLDIYSLGAVLYFLLNGEAPPKAVDRFQGRSLHWSKGLPKALRRIIEEAMALEPGRRIATVAQLQECLRVESLRTQDGKGKAKYAGCSGAASPGTSSSASSPGTLAPRVASSKYGGHSGKALSRMKGRLRPIEAFLGVVAVMVWLLVARIYFSDIPRSLVIFLLLLGLSLFLVVVSLLLSRGPRFLRQGWGALRPLPPRLEALSKVVVRTTGSPGLAAFVTLTAVALPMAVASQILYRLNVFFASPFVMIALSMLVALIIEEWKPLMSKRDRESLWLASLLTMSVGVNALFLEWLG